MDEENLLQSFEHVENRTLDEIVTPHGFPDSPRRLIYLQSSAARRAYIISLTTMIIFTDVNKIRALLQVQNIHMTAREKSYMIAKIMQYTTEETIQGFKEVIKTIESLKEPSQEIYAYSHFADERRAVESIERQRLGSVPTLTERIQKIRQREKKKID